MTPKYNSADSSFYYHENAAADLAHMNSSVVYGNLADAMKNATVLLPSPLIIEKLTVNKSTEYDDR